MGDRAGPEADKDHERLTKNSPVVLAIIALLASLVAYGAATWRYSGMIDMKDTAIASHQTVVQGLNASLSNLRAENNDLRSRLTTAEAALARTQRPRDPDAIFQMGSEVGRVVGAIEDRAASTMSFELVEGNGNFDRAKEFEYRNMVLRITTQSRATTSFTGRGVQTRLTDVRAAIVKAQAPP